MVSCFLGTDHAWNTAIALKIRISEQKELYFVLSQEKKLPYQLEYR